MSKASNSLVAAAAVLVLQGCAHTLTADYGQYLQNNAGRMTFDRANVATQYTMTPSTRAHRYEFRSVAAGAANTWVVEFGQVIDGTMQSPDVRAALGAMNPVGESEGNQGGTIVFHLRRYAFENFQANVDLSIAVKRDGKEVFQKNYLAQGLSTSGRTIAGGAFAIKSAVQTSTKSAVDQILTRFFQDVQGLK